MVKPFKDQEIVGTVEAIEGAGYLPFKGGASHLLCKADLKHSHFIIAKARKEV